MKLHIFQETGEFRKVKFGEWYINHEGDFDRCEFTDALFAGTIVLRSVVEIPDNTNHIRVVPYKDSPPEWVDTMKVSIVNHKPRVKKWQWLYRTIINPVWETTAHYKTEEEARAAAPYRTSLMIKLEESEIEVEE